MDSNRKRVELLVPYVQGTDYEWSLIKVRRGIKYLAVLIRPRVWRMDGEGFVYREHRGLLAPVSGRQNDHLRDLVSMLEAARSHPGRRMLVVGHCADSEASGDPVVLSEARAASIVALLDGDRDTWVQVASRWGSPAAVADLLAYVAVEHGWPCGISEFADEGDPPPEFARAVRGFQAAYSRQFSAIDIDGICGEQTLGALFDVQREILAALAGERGVELEGIPWFEDAKTMTAATEFVASPEVRGHGRCADVVLIDSRHLASSEPLQPSTFYGASKVKNLLVTGGASSGDYQSCDLLVPVEWDVHDDPAQHDAVELRDRSDAVVTTLSPTDPNVEAMVSRRLLVYRFAGVPVGVYSVWLATEARKVCTLPAVVVSRLGVFVDGNQMPSESSVSDLAVDDVERDDVLDEPSVSDDGGCC